MTEDLTADEGPGSRAPLYLEYWSSGDRLTITEEEEAAQPEVLLPAITACTLLLRGTGEECGERLAQRAPRVLAHAARSFLTEIRSGSTADILAADCHMSREMFLEAAANFFPQLTEAALREFRERSLQAGPGGAGRVTVLPPALVFHVPAGNLFISGIESLVYASLCGACSLVRCPSSGAEAIHLWHRCLEAADPDFAATVAVGRWPRRFPDLTRAAARNADVVIAFGSDRSVEKIRELTPVGAKFIPHGTKLSFALIGRDALNGSEADLKQLADALAYDFTIYDQQGCLSPRAAFLQSPDLEKARTFARLLRRSMADLALRLPPPELSLEEGAALARARDEAAMDEVLGGEVELLSGRSDPFVVTL